MIREDYNELKKRYFRTLQGKGATKGDIRAFIGLKTMLYEANAPDSLEPMERHLLAFKSALDDLGKAPLNKKKVFNQELRIALTAWQNSDINVNRKPVESPLLPPPIPNIHKWHRNGHSLVSLFSGAFGLDLGFLAAGFDSRFATDIDKLSYETAKANLDNTPFILRNYDSVTCEEVLKTSGLAVGELSVLIGGPPCQPFSTAGKREGFNDPRSSPLRGFIRSINELKPRAFVMEEVPGLESSRLVHIPISERGKRALKPEEEEGSAFKEVIRMLESTGYKFVHGRLNAADYGAPQVRERLVFIGLRDGTPSLPPPTHSLSTTGDLFTSSLLPWNTYWEATADLSQDGDSANFSEKIADYMRVIPPGGHWRQLPEDVIPMAMGGAYEAGGGKMGFYRRLAWDEPSPTVVTSPLQKGTIFGHPEQLRPLSISEYKRIQGFPDDWFLPGSNMDRYKLIGNAVSVHFSFALAKHVISLLRG